MNYENTLLFFFHSWKWRINCQEMRIYIFLNLLQKSFEYFGAVFKKNILLNQMLSENKFPEQLFACPDVLFIFKTAAKNNLFCTFTRAFCQFVNVLILMLVFRFKNQQKS